MANLVPMKLIMDDNRAMILTCSPMVKLNCPTKDSRHRDFVQSHRIHLWYMCLTFSCISLTLWYI